MTDRNDIVRADTLHNGSVPPDWFEAAFGELYPVIYAHRTAEAAAPEAEFACAQTQLGAQDSALDLCCGAGRHMVSLVHHAARVAGVDYSPGLLRRARRTLGTGPVLVRADMRRLPFHARFDVVFNFFTSFGYFADEQDNQEAAREMARVLKPGGRLFMDYMNAEHDVPRLVAASERNAGTRRILERRWYDAKLHRVNKVIEVLRDGQPEARLTESVRAYGKVELCAMLEDAGMRVVKAFGAADGRPFGADAPRLILVAIKRQNA
jgi:ubiquinone/menaquinone biosynthesis C-methylase UbiE